MTSGRDTMMKTKLHRAITAGIVLYLCSATVLIVGGVPSAGLFGIFLWLQACLVRGGPPSIDWLAGVFLIVQLCAFVLIAYGSIRQFMARRVTPATVGDERAWPHFAVAALLAIAAGSVFIGFDVWTSTKLDLVGATAHGSWQPVRDYTVRYEFATEEGQIITAIRSHTPDANAFVYLRDNPHVFKVKGSGRGPQIGFLLLVGLAVWQFVTGTTLLQRRKSKLDAASAVADEHRSPTGESDRGWAPMKIPAKVVLVVLLLGSFTPGSSYAQPKIRPGVPQENAETRPEAQVQLRSDPLWRDFRKAYDALDFAKASDLGDQLLEKYGDETDPSVVGILYGLVVAAYGLDERIPEQDRDEKRKAALERGIAVCERALEKGDTVTKLNMLATLGRLCGQRAVGPGWQDDRYVEKGLAVYREVLTRAETLLEDKDTQLQRRGRAWLWLAYKGSAEIHGALEDYAQAVALYKQALKREEIAESRDSIQKALAQTYHKWGKRVEEMQTCLAAVEQAGTDRPYFTPAVKERFVDMYRAAVSAAKTSKSTDMQTLTIKYQRTADLFAIEARDFAETANRPLWRFTLWESLVPVADLLADYYTEKGGLAEATEPYAHLMEEWPDEGRFKSKVLVKLGNLYEEFERRDEAVEAYRKVIQIGHQLAMGDRLKARSRLQALGEDVRIPRSRSTTDKRVERITERPEEARAETPERVRADPTRESLEAERRGMSRFADARKAARRTLCATNLEMIGLLFHGYANENEGRYPPIDDRRGNLMIEGDEIFPKYERWLDGILSFQCPSRKRHGIVKATNLADAVTDESYFYLGWAVTDDVEGLVLHDAYNSLDLTQRDQDISAPKGKGNFGRDKIFRIREGMERFYITDINNPPVSAMAQARMPVMWERPGNHYPAGGHVLYMDGHVEFVEYPGKFPMTPRFMKRLIEISAAKTVTDKAAVGEPTDASRRVAPLTQEETAAHGVAFGLR